MNVNAEVGKARESNAVGKVAEVDCQKGIYSQKQEMHSIESDPYSFSSNVCNARHLENAGAVRSAMSSACFDA